MADSITAPITGTREVQAKLQQLAAELVEMAWGKALQAGIDVMADAVRERTPVKTGLLKENVVTALDLSRSAPSGIAAAGFGPQGHVSASCGIWTP